MIKIIKITFLVALFIHSAFCSAQTKQASNDNLAYKEALIAVNNTFLKKIFVSNYINNTTYILSTDLSMEDQTLDLQKAYILLNSMKLTVSGDSLLVCQQALDFNENYLKLYEIRKGGVLNVKYDQLKVNTVISSLDKLPTLAKGSKLEITKAKIRNIIEGYPKKMIALKPELDQLKKPDQDNPVIKNKYLLLEKKYSDYPYLVKVIRESKNGKNTYQTELDVKVDNSSTP